MNIKNPKIVISLFTFSDIYSHEKGEKLLRNWQGKYPQFFPEVVFWNESKGGTHPVEDVHTLVDGVVTKWSSGKLMPFWKLGGKFFSYHKSKPKSSVFYSLGGLDYRKSSTLAIEMAYDPKVDWKQFFLDLSLWFEASFGFLHLVTEREQDFARKNLSADVGLFSLFAGVYPVDRVRGFPAEGMPHLGWLTLYGGEFLPLMGKNLPNLPDNNHFKRDGKFFVQLSEQISDLVTDYDKVESTRRSLKTIIGREYFEKYLGEGKTAVFNDYFFKLDGSLGLSTSE